MKHGGFSVFGGVGERTREGNDLYLEINEDPGVVHPGGPDEVEGHARVRTDDGATGRAAARRLSGLTVTEYFRDVEGRTCCCSSTTSSVLRRPARRCPRCSAGCRLRWATADARCTEMGELQERITSTKKGSITSVQAIYVPADDYTDPAPATTFAHLGRDDEPVAGDRRARHLPGRRSARVDGLPMPVPYNYSQWYIDCYEYYSEEPYTSEKPVH